MDLQLRLENHWLACMAGAGGGGRVTRMPGALAVTNPRVGGVSFNFLTLRATPPEALDDILDMGSALLAGDRRHPALFLAPPAGDQLALSAALQARGWRPVLEQSVLVCDLTAAAATPQPNPAVAVTEIGPEALDTWGQLLVDAYEVEPGAGREIRAGWTALMARPGEGCHARFYLAALDGRQVGTGLTWSQGDTAGLYCGAVLPDSRRRGVETATLQRRLCDAARDGCLLAVLQTESGSPVETLCREKFGFQWAYHRSLWRPSFQ